MEEPDLVYIVFSASDHRHSAFERNEADVICGIFIREHREQSGIRESRLFPDLVPQNGLLNESRSGNYPLKAFVSAVADHRDLVIELLKEAVFEHAVNYRALCISVCVFGENEFQMSSAHSSVRPEKLDQCVDFFIFQGDHGLSGAALAK